MKRWQIGVILAVVAFKLGGFGFVWEYGVVPFKSDKMSQNVPEAQLSDHAKAILERRGNEK